MTSYSYTAENIPQSIMKTILEDHWTQFSECPKPTIVVVNDPDDVVARINTRDGDFLTIKQEGAEVVTYRGNITYYDRILPMTLDIFTMTSRQRLRDIWKQIKVIIFDKKHSGAQEMGYQLIRLGSYTEMVNESNNIWRGTIKLQVEAHGVLCDTF
jgi:hypothetical protein